MSDSPGKKIIERVLHEVAADVEGIFDNPFFLALSEAKLSYAGIRLFANEYYWASNGFPKIFATACAGMSTDELRMPIVENLWDEHGRGNPSKSHRTMLLRFLQFLNVQPNGTPAGPAARYIDMMIDLCRGATEAQLLGILCPGCEAFTPREYRLIVGCLKRDFAVPDDALEFFVDHIGHDYEHVSAFQNAFRIAVKSDSALLEAITGAKRAIQIERIFWENMHAFIVD